MALVSLLALSVLLTMECCRHVSQLADGSYHCLPSLILNSLGQVGKALGSLAASQQLALGAWAQHILSAGATESDAEESAPQSTPSVTGALVSEGYAVCLHMIAKGKM